jgi:ribosomal protein L14
VNWGWESKHKMIQTQTEILIKDNSGLLKGRCINASHKSFQGIGDNVKIAVRKSKARLFKGKQKRKGIQKTQDVLIIQTRKAMSRWDGSSIKFDSNSGVCVSLKPRLHLGFHRIKSMVPFELKRISPNLLKLAKNRV